MLDQLLPHLTAFNVVGFLAAAWTLRLVVSWIVEERTIRAFGGHAAYRRPKLPLGVDVIYEGVTCAKKNRNLEFWIHNFEFGHPANPNTIETRLGERIILTADPDNIKAILATQFAEYGKGPVFNRDWHDFLGDSIFTTDKEKWHDSRQLIRPQFIKDRLSDLKTFEHHLQKLLPQLGGDGQTVDVANLFFKYTLDAATDFLFGKSVDSLDTDHSAFSEAFADVQAIQNLMSRMGHLQKFYPRGKFNRQLRVINEFVNPFIDQALALPQAELEKNTRSDEGYTFLHALARYTRDRTVLRDQLVAVLLAGRDTTACTLSWLFYELSTKPHIVRRLRREIEQTVGRHAAPTYAHLKSMRYLTHCLNETLRLYPVVPYNVRVALRDTTLPRGGGPDGNAPIGVCEGTQIAYSTLYMQRRPDLYPPASSGFPQVAEFVPERWESWTPKAWTYIPFNGGPRICVGQQFALTEMAYTVTRIFQSFDTVESRQGGEEMEMKADIVLSPAYGVKVAFRNAGTSEKA